jgi:hypothetical protein
MREIAKRSPAGRGAPTGHIPLTPRSIAIITTATKIAAGPTETTHVARGIAQLADGKAAQVMAELSQLSADELVTELDRLFETDLSAFDTGTGRSASDAGIPSRAGLEEKLDRIADELSAIRRQLTD